MGQHVEIDHPGDADIGEEAGVVADDHEGASVRLEGLDQRLVRREVEVVRRLVEQEQLRRGVGEEQRRERRPEALPTGQDTDELVGGTTSEEELR